MRNQKLLPTPNSSLARVLPLSLALLLNLGQLNHARAAEVPAPPAPRPYAMSAYELASELPAGLRRWSAGDLKRTLRERVAREKARPALDVDYYRIGYKISFPLRLNRRPTVRELPAGIASMTYPWLIWYSWELEERWRLLHFAWRHDGDRDAGVLLQQELAALAGWDRFAELNEQVGLVTGHFAAVLALALADSSGWDPTALRQARAAAAALLERDVWPWFIQQWPDKPLNAGNLGNIPAIALVRSAQLARVMNNPRCGPLEARARALLAAWCRCRLGPERHTEGTAYDGYLLDSVTEWMAGLPDRATILRQSSAAFRNQAEHWLGLTLPGRLDLQAPLGDVEAEMEFWATALTRLAAWYNWADAAWLARRIPLARFRVGALTTALEAPSLLNQRGSPPAPGWREHPNALSLRTGWDTPDLLAVVGLSRGKPGHLHSDGGQLIVGWQGRFWITDPGYQQYRPGPERDYTLGPEAHNVPVIGGRTQVWRNVRLLRAETNRCGGWQALADATGCYRGLPAGATVQRQVRLFTGDGMGIVACDRLAGLATNVEASVSWQLGHHLGCAFRDGWLRLSDGRHALWLGSYPGGLEAAQVTRHPGSRGPLTLTRSWNLPNGTGERWWVFWCDATGGWTPPSLTFENGDLRVRKP